MTFKETVELEAHIKIKKRAIEIMDRYKNVTLKAAEYQNDGKFLVWSDSHNAKFFQFKADKVVFQCRFLHESYDVEVSNSGVFNAIKEGNRGLEHFESFLNQFNKS